ncbi:MAG: hypothetical protein D6790_10375 [Caldilineae bacterium]|nr:MAG: hypothetical protein D6790_10375 [Caldilineae bacterium]
MTDWDPNSPSTQPGDGNEATDEPVFTPVDPEPAFPPVQEPPPEPVFAPAEEPAAPRPADPGVTVTWEGSEAPPLSRDRRLGRTGPFWVAAAIVGMIIIVALWFRLGRDVGTVSEPEQPAAVTEGQAAPAAALEPTPTPIVTPEPTPTPTPALLEPGQRVVVGNTDGFGIRLRAEPGTGALTLAIYEDGTPFVVLDPGSEYDAYPVEVDGYRWYRLRVADNPQDQLVGWAAGDFLLPEPGE